MAADNQGCSANRRRQAFSFSVTLRPSMARRARIVRPPAPPPSCEESTHYPVFNPLDPRHNPAVVTSSWNRGGCYAPRNTNLESPVSWVQSLSKRSLRRARSGLIALRAGMQRRASIFGTNRTANIPRAWPSSDATEGSSDQRDDASFPSTISEASTEEDSDFGTHLHRTECNDASSLSCDVDKCLDNWPFSVTITDLNPFQELTGGYWPPGLFLTEAAHSIFPRDSTDGNNGLGLQISRELTTGDYIQLDDLFMNESGSESEGSLPRLSRSSKSLPDPGGSQITGAEAEPSHSAILTPLPNTLLAPVSLRDPSVNGSTSQIMDPLPSPGLPRPPTTDGQPSGRFYVSRTPQVSNAALVVESRGLIDRVSAYSDNSIGRTEDEVGDQALTPAIHHESSLDVQAEPPQSECQSTTEEAQTQDIAESGTNASLSNDPVCTVLTLSTNLADATSERPNDDNHHTPPRPSGDTGGLGCSDCSGEQSPWSARPSEEVTVTDLTSVSNNLWTSIENGDLASLLSFTDEYFFVDGKTSGHPDRGDNPTKTERSIMSDEGLYNGLGHDRIPSAGTLDVPEIIGPGRAIHIPPPRPYRAERDASDDSVDEYLLTYPMYQRRYFP
ncbi:hypothetical protein ABOM_010227 [Aspergillus bombycis]|uniref:Uncharacterized protein n=1 Tax=Aspergillus bombycis TaxID=109264 RepID=A0A1F7ZPU0_9EURO|nr:hypothetical protein ABOM_010227 [Aspergillus bombycis]OGM41065.1 hypothetical protein ABOM_010227 [Aspergillus bombycis]